ncbi:MAG: hypothetical protein Q8P18_03035 [Pseudomonadota bacterium]|nr:hypothetical protein [Pseudomonadota bacterium]
MLENDGTWHVDFAPPAPCVAPEAEVTLGGVFIDIPDGTSPLGSFEQWRPLLETIRTFCVAPEPRIRAQMELLQRVLPRIVVQTRVAVG